MLARTLVLMRIDRLPEQPARVLPGIPERLAPVAHILGVIPALRPLCRHPDSIPDWRTETLTCIGFRQISPLAAECCPEHESRKSVRNTREARPQSRLWVESCHQISGRNGSKAPLAKLHWRPHAVRAE